MLVTAASVSALLAGCADSSTPAGRLIAPAPSTSAKVTVTDTPTGPCRLRPDGTNTGATGTRTAYRGTVLDNGVTLKDADAESLDIKGSGVTVSNVAVAGNILITGDHVTLDHVTTQGIAVSSGSDVTIRYTNIGFGTEDAIHLTSDRESQVTKVVLEYNYIHDPRVQPGSHYDGTQIRGADGVSISCSTYDPGPYQSTFNAAIYLENANGGVRNVSIQNNWLYGFGFSVMLDATGTTITGNEIGGDIKWGDCYLNKDTPLDSITASGNHDEAGKPIAVCANH